MVSVLETRPSEYDVVAGGPRTWWRRLGDLRRRHRKFLLGLALGFAISSVYVKVYLEPRVEETTEQVEKLLAESARRRAQRAAHDQTMREREEELRAIGEYCRSIFEEE